jgi:molybdopterin converting factor small subunit
MQIRVRYFASLREQRGCSEEIIELDTGTTARAAYQKLCPPALLPIAYAINEAYSSADSVLKDGDELVFLPPLGGG